jgi:hypothetical protein
MESQQPNWHVSHHIIEMTSLKWAKRSGNVANENKTTPIAGTFDGTAQSHYLQRMWGRVFECRKVFGKRVVASQVCSFEVKSETIQ